MYGTIITALRKKHKFSQKELGDHLGIGVSSISLWEQGKRQPSLDNIISIAKLFGVSTDYILLGESEKKEVTRSEAEFLELYNQLSDVQKSEIKGIVHGLLMASSNKSGIDKI